MKAKEISPKKLVVFDIDDTLVHTQTKVHVIKNGEIVDSLNSHDFTHYKLQPGEEFDFGDFRNAREFFEKSRPIIPMMNQLKRDIATGNKVVMVTARADFDDKELFLDTFRKFGIDMGKVHVYRAGNSKEGSTEERKKAIIKKLLDSSNYTKAIMYDDAKPNLHTFMELKKDHPKTKFYAWHVSLQGEASEYMREDFMAEKKKRRSKSRWAPYGPGPYGGYGYLVGYSGDANSSDGGVGEASYDGNIGMMEVVNFFKIATEAQKKLFKELLQKGKRGLAWKLIQDVTDTKLKGKEFEVEEGWRDTLAGLALGAGVALGSGSAEANVEKVQVSKGDTVYSIAKAFGTTPQTIQKLNKLDKNFSIRPGQTIKVPAGEVIDIIDNPSKEKKAEPEKKKTSAKVSTKTKTLTGNPFESLLTDAARSGGITDPIELAAFLAQALVETGKFKDLDEKGSRKRIERMYDPKYNPEGADEIGNTKIGDGWRFRGRGFLQLTGRYNYTAASKALGINLVKDPDLALKPEVAAKTAVWYWKWRVRPNVTNFNDTAKITELVQGGKHQLERRKTIFADFKKFKLAQI
jgi:putative chitinase